MRVLKHFHPEKEEKKTEKNLGGKKKLQCSSKRKEIVETQDVAV